MSAGMIKLRTLGWEITQVGPMQSQAGRREVREEGFWRWKRRPVKTGKGKETDCPYSLQKEHSPADLAWSSNLQNYEIICCVILSLVLWWFVEIAIGNQCSKTKSGRDMESKMKDNSSQKVIRSPRPELCRKPRSKLLGLEKVDTEISKREIWRWGW